MIPVDVLHLEILLVSTVRYALGRRTYIVGDACDLVRAYAPRVRAGERAVILRDVEEALRRHDACQGAIGDPCDVREWRALATWLRERERSGA